MNEERLIVLFDGVCNLCNNTVQFIIRNDSKGKFRFAALQSETGQRLLEKYQLDTKNFNSFILIDNNKPRLKSTGALYLVKNLSGFFPLLFAFIIIPPFIRDWIYDKVAQNRYKWFGKKDQCMVPTPELKARFLN
ncbi:hypothetical protein D3C72_804600 [compost metagenome]